MLRMRKTLSLLVMVALVAAAVSFAPAPAPAAAASPSPATFLPATTALYAEIQTTDVKGTLKSSLDLFSKLSGTTIEAEMILAMGDQQLSQLLGRPATLEKDVLAWLGDSIGLAWIVPDVALTARDLMQATSGVVVISVKDDAAAEKFLTDVLAVLGRQRATFTRTPDDTVGGNKVALYTNALAGVTIAQWKGVLAVGSAAGVTEMLDTLKTNKMTLANDAKFKKVSALVKPNSLLKVIATSRLSGISMAFNSAMTRPAPGTEAAMKRLEEIMKLSADATNGSAFALRQEGKVLSIDVAQSVDPAAQAKLMTTLGIPELKLKQPAGKIAERIPGNALAVLAWGDIEGIYKWLKGAALGFSKLMQDFMPSPFSGPRIDVTKQIQDGIAQVEAMIKAAIGLDLNTDILGWMGGEFAVYMTYSKDGTLSKASRGQWPFDHTLVIQTTDKAKATTFTTKLTDWLEKQLASMPVQRPNVTKKGDLIVVSGAQGGLGYGVANDTFILTTDSGLDAAAAAARGDGILAKNPVWQNAVKAIGGTINQPILYLNLVEIAAAAKEITSDPGRQLSARDAADMQRLLNILGQFESAVISGTDLGNGSSTGMIALILK